MEKGSWANPPCSFCGNPSGGYAIYEDTGTAYCSDCFERLKLPELQAMYPDNYGPILVLIGIVGLLALAIVLRVIVGVAPWIMG